MLKKIHLVGDVQLANIEIIIEALSTTEDIEKIEYKESTHDIHFETSRIDYMELLAKIIEETQLNIKTVERKRSGDTSEKVFEKKIYLFSNLQSSENAVFLVSYLLNDPQVSEARFDHQQKILTVITTDPFIYTKIRHVIDAFGENIEITENYVLEKTFNYGLMYRYLYIALLLFSFSLFIVTSEEPSIVTMMSGIVMYGLLAKGYVVDAMRYIKNKMYINTNNIVLLGTLLLLIFNRPLEASIALIVYYYLHLAFQSFERQIIDRLVNSVDNLIRIVKVETSEGIEEKQVEEVEIEDVIIQEGGIFYFDGVVLEGHGEVDSMLMKGNEQFTPIQQGDLIFSGTSLNSGSIKFKVTKMYKDTIFNRLFIWNPRRLKETGYLEKRDNKEFLYITYAFIALSLLGIILGYINQSTILVISSCALLTTIFPFALSRLTPYIYENIMIEALIHRVIIKDEDSLGKIIEWVRKQKCEKISEDIDLNETDLKVHLGNYLDETIREENDCIYTSKKELVNIFNFIKYFDKQWIRLKYLSYIFKIVVVLLFYVQLFNFFGLLFANGFLAFIILVVVKYLLDKEVS